MAPKSRSKKMSKHTLSNVQNPPKKQFRKGDVPSMVEDDVPDFPRGGGSSLSREELDQVRAEVDAEFEAEERILKKRKKQRWTSEDDPGSLFGGGINGKLPKFANRITFKNISPGMKVWGVVSEVNEKDIVVSLPGGLRGLVRASEAIELDEAKLWDMDTNFLSSVYHIGQLVSCIILQLDDDKKEAGKRKIWLSLRLALLHKGLTLEVIQEGMILSAYVKSMEDHGYMLNFGSPFFSGFMSKDNQFENVEVKITSGQLVQGVVRSVDRTRKVVYLSCDADAVSKFVTKDLKGISIDLLVPGMMVNATVRSVLENGIMLSFLTYFTGTADMFNLQQTFPSSNWKVDYPQNKKVNARILFIDPSTRAVGLTLNPHLVQNKAPPTLIKVGDIFDQSKVIRVDRGLGLLLEIPSSPFPTPAFVNVSDVADKEVKKLDKSFKEGRLIRVRVLGFRHLEGLATGVLKTSAFEGSVFTHSDVKPGMVVKAKVIAVDSFGAIVQFSSGVKALCPLRHMSEFEIVKPRKKFQVGAELVFRILGCKSKRITVTHKKTLVKSKLEILGSYADATEGLVTHGWLTKIENHGCFVRFYNGVQGFAPRSELELDPGCEISSMYHIEQVVKCRVTSSNPALRRINLSFTTSPSRVSSTELVKPGKVVSGVVVRVTPDAVVIDVAQGHFNGKIFPQHLTDHSGLADLMKSTLRPGYEFNQLLVLDVEGSTLILSAKDSLVSSAQKLPLDVHHVHLYSVLHGYICNIIESGVFIRFLGRLTGFSPKNKATDDRRCNLSEVYQIGQSLRTSVVDVSSETSRITLSLKQSLCSSEDASFLQEYFLTEEKIAKLQLVDSVGSDLRWLQDFTLGSTVKGKVNEIKEFGVVVSFQKYGDVFGFIPHDQLGGVSVVAGSSIRAAVLDISKIEHLVDLSLKPQFLKSSKKETANNQAHKKRKREALGELEVNQSINAVVEIVKENYLVVSLPSYNNTLGYASRADYNIQNHPPKSFAIGESVTTTVMALPSPSTSGRLLLFLQSLSKVIETSSSKRAKKNSSYIVGSLVQAEITEVRPLELRLKFGSRFHGRVHITEVLDEKFAEAPFSNFRFGQTLSARIISKFKMSESVKRGYQWELSIKPSTLAGSGEIEPAEEEFNYSIGQPVCGFVYKVDNEWAWLTLSRDVKAQLYILDSSSEPSELAKFQKTFCVGRAFSGYVLSANKEKKLVRLISHDPGREGVNHIHEGSVLGGRVTKILAGVGGLLVQIDPHLYGKVHFTELTDAAGVAVPLSGYHEGQFVKCKVLEINHSVKGTLHIDLSLRSIHLSQLNVTPNIPGLVEKIDDLYPNMVVTGYVKNVTPKGCFVMLSRKVDAKILLSNLSDGYVENPEKEFPVGRHVTGKVVSVEPLSKRVEVTLRTSTAVSAAKSVADALNNLIVGDAISGRVKRVEPYGLFITVDHANVVGLCHISEIPDGHVINIESRYKPGDRVTAKILKVDKERQRVSLGMKNSDLNAAADATSDEIKPRVIETSPSPERSSQFLDAAIGETKPRVIETSPPERSSQFLDAAIVETKPRVIETSSSPERSSELLAEVESRASIPPLEVLLDDTESMDVADNANQETVHVGDAHAASLEQNKKNTARKDKRLREEQIRAAEERLLEKDIPRDADEFEKLVRSSPNSSFVWIKYMAFMLSLADVDKARSLAERALRTISIREETEKLNVWVAYFNLENEYGKPPEEAVGKIFQRALQYCDPKKVHVALLGMYERTEQHKLADELLNRMVKKFKHSCKVWLRRVQWQLKQSQDGVQSVVNRALLSLPLHKHIKFITQTAILEFKCGVPDRGRSLLEKMLREYPKRTDLWSIYLDQEIRRGDADVIRALFERAITLSLPPKKMKFLFKKYLEYEKTVGDDQRVEAVKRKAMEYVETSNA